MRNTDWHPIVFVLLVSMTIAATFVGTGKVAYAQCAEWGLLGSFLCTDLIRQAGNVVDFGGNAPRIVALIVQAVLAVVTVLTLGAVVAGGVMYITSLGDEQRTKSAKLIIMYALIGLFIAILSVVIVNAAINIFAQGKVIK